MKYRKIFILPAFICNTCILHAQDTTINHALSFEEALQVMLHNNHGLKQTDYLYRQKQAEAQAAKGLYFPKVGLSGGYVAMQKDISLDLTPIRDAITPLYNVLGNYGKFSGVPNPDPATNAVVPVLPDDVSTQVIREKMLEGLQTVQNANWNPTIQKQYFGSVMATAQLPIYTGGKIKAANAAATIEEKEVTEQNRQKIGELTSELAERYFGMKLAEEAIKVRQDVLEGMNRHLQDALKLEKEGIIAHAEVLHAEVYQAEADRELKKAQQNAHIVNQALLNTLGVTAGSTVEPVSNLFYTKNMEPVDYFKESANKNSPLLQQIQTKKELTEQGVKVEKSALYPSIALEGMYNIVNPSDYAPNWIAGVAAKWTLFDGFARKQKIKAAAYKTDQVNEAMLKAQSDINTMIEKLYSTLTMYSDQLDALNTAQKFAEEYLRVREKGFREEMNTSTEVVDARLNLSKVKIEKLEAMYNYDKTLAQLLQYAGIPEQFEKYRLQYNTVTEKY